MLVPWRGFFFSPCSICGDETLRKLKGACAVTSERQSTFGFLLGT